MKKNSLEEGTLVHLKTNWKEELGPPLLGSGGHMKEPGLQSCDDKVQFLFLKYSLAAEENRLEHGELKAKSHWYFTQWRGSYSELIPYC